MALVSVGIPYFHWPVLLNGSGSTSMNTGLGSHLLDAASEATSLVMQAPATGTIDRVKWRTNTWTTAGADPIEITIEQVASNGLPNFTKTLWGTNTEGTKTPVATDDNVWIETTLTSGASVSQGDIFAICIRNPPANHSNFNVAVKQTANNPYGSTSDYLPKGATATGAPPTAFTNVNDAYPMIAVRYSDGTWVSADRFMTGSGQNNVYNSTTNPRYRGNRFKAPFRCRVKGINAFISNMAASSSFIARIRNDSGTALASSPTYEGAFMNGTTLDGSVPVLFTEDLVLEANTWYRMTIEPQGTGNMGLASLDIGDTDIMTVSPGGTDFYLTTSNDLSSWSDTTTEKHSMELIISEIDDGTGVPIPAGRGSRTHLRM